VPGHEAPESGRQGSRNRPPPGLGGPESPAGHSGRGEKPWKATHGNAYADNRGAPRRTERPMIGQSSGSSLSGENESAAATCRRHGRRRALTYEGQGMDASGPWGLAPSPPSPRRMANRPSPGLGGPESPAGHPASDDTAAYVRGGYYGGKKLERKEPGVTVTRILTVESS
jgi:hypothetical protein